MNATEREALQKKISSLADELFEFSDGVIILLSVYNPDEN